MKECVLALALCQWLCFSVSGQLMSPTSHLWLRNIIPSGSPADTSTRAGLHQHAVAPEAAAEWTTWSTVDNLQFGKNRGDLPMITDLRALHPYFRDKVEELIRRCAQSGISLAVVESYRTPAKQAEYYAMGKQYTNTQGGRSRHQYGLAIDVVPMVNSMPVWTNHRLWRRIGLIGERLGLRWGGRWRVLYDPGHFEWVGGCSRAELADGEFPQVPAAALDQYPGLMAQLKKLQSDWKAWAAEQRVTVNRMAAKAGEGATSAGARY